ncbi:hypothetical protein HRR83_002261 [Exophiala dermatitidis]|nr:hypothetical protein HRR74_002338 [Exophiala dermatitidis]KAJ4555495.1 hypothetical protein HRR77_001426 [Exophiala dermatitidis]KAJ4568800.1 hypothetical protein HRR81_006457 [Exophiala dermatitidis]KAJ4586462.1 hypothetical protein HRR82_002080 [Exophiala dermatitidis]KAJ4603205.1 hypothetical protein HRR83_002261 [Exophiala dermatitidis]
MDGGDRRRSQYGQPYQTPAHSRSLPGQSIGASSSDRFSQSGTPARSDVGRSPIARPYLPGYSGYGYTEQQYGSSQMQSSSPMQGLEMQYPPAYLQDSSRHQQVQASPSQHQPQPQQQQYPTYTPGSMLPPVAPQSLYDNIPYQQRQTAIEVMASQFAVPQYMPSSGQAGAAVGSGSSPYLTSQAEQSPYAAVAQPETGESAGAAPSAAQTALDEGLREFYQQLRLTFEAIIAGRVTEASEKLLAMSRWLVGSITALGLHHDDEARHSERLHLWREFNLAWEALGQKQKDITEEALRTGRPPTDVLSANAITSLVDDLISLCDQLEQYGLVDYEMGIWEEQITHIFIVCLDLISQGEAPARTGQTPVPAE